MTGSLVAVFPKRTTSLLNRISHGGSVRALVEGLGVEGMCVASLTWAWALTRR